MGEGVCETCAQSKLRALQSLFRAHRPLLRPLCQLLGLGTSSHGVRYLPNLMQV